MCQHGIYGGQDVSSSKRLLSNYFNDIQIITCDYSNCFFIGLLYWGFGTVKASGFVFIGHGSCQLQRWSHSSLIPLKWKGQKDYV